MNFKKLLKKAKKIKGPALLALGLIAPGVAARIIRNADKIDDVVDAVKGRRQNPE